MAVVVFKWGDLPDHTRKGIIKDAGWVFYSTFPIEEWFDPRYNTTITRMYNKAWVVDFLISMPREKYAEFCLKWL